VASQLLRLRIPLLLLSALTLVLSACGGGTTGGSVAGTTAASAPALPPATPTTTTAPAPTATAPKRTGANAAAPRTTQTSTAADPPPEPAPAPRPAPADAPPPAQTQSAPAPAPEPAGTPIDERAELTLTDRESPAHYFQQGTVTGTYEGTMAAEVRITSKGVFVDFTATVEGGTIVGRALAVAVIDGRPMPALRGTAAIHGGTGRFAAIHARGLKVTGRSKPDGSQARVRLVGVVQD
jgi:hypothetical protein